MTAANRNKILFIMMMSSFVTPFTSSALTLSLPDIGKAYHASANELGWVLEIFLLVSIVFLLPMGKLADRLGKRRIFFWGTVLFTISSFLCIFTPNMPLLLAARGLQGVAAAMLYATNMSIVALVFPPEKRGWALGWMVSMVYVGLACGPVLGGLLNYYAGWQSIFIFITLACLSCVLATQQYLHEEWLAKDATGVDGKGAVLYGIAMVLAMFGLSELANLSWAWGALLGGLFVFGFFVRHELQAKDPILPLYILSGNREFSLSNLAAMINYSATFGISFLLSIYLQSVLGLSSREAGFMMLIQPIVMAMLSPVTGKLSDQYAPGKLASLGMGVTALGLLGMVITVHLRSLWLVVPVVMVIGVGFALFAAPNNNAIMSSVPKKYYSLATSMLGTVRLVGQVTSVAIVTMILSLSWSFLMPSDELLRNIELSFIVFTILCAAGIVPSAARSKNRPQA
ncbi:MAG: Spectinomycin tetracycline efflux pump [Mitsuokella multacida]|jgi:EmrB/QacA subfamily drug resistance transporter